MMPNVKALGMLFSSSLKKKIRSGYNIKRHTNIEQHDKN